MILPNLVGRWLGVDQGVPILCQANEQDNCFLCSFTTVPPTFHPSACYRPRKVFGTD
jgi:hypothetical protein